jgi:hypothetical protein
MIFYVSNDKYIPERELDIPECWELQVVVHHWCDKCLLRLPLKTLDKQELGIPDRFNL